MTRGWISATLALAGCGFEASGAPVTGDAMRHPSCDVAPDLAWWRLKESPLDLDVLAGVPATATGAVTPIADGPCLDALALEPTPAIPYLAIDDRPAWDDLGRIELWLRTTDAPLSGILSRDSNGNHDGTISLYEATQDATPVLAVRLQQAAGGITEILCAPRPPAGTWVHVRIELAPGTNRLFVDDLEGTVTGPANTPGDVPCGTSTLPLLPSQDPFVLGAANDSSSPGTISNLRIPFSGGAISNLKFFRRTP